jgi:hypothetical protein
MKPSIPLLIITTLLVSALFAGTIFQEYSATPETNQVTIKWRTSSENQVVKFKIMRSMDDQSFSEVSTTAAKGQGEDYTFVDENVMFKSTQTFFYKIQALRSDNTIIEETQSLIVNPNISGIYRTWGAIKAMFR